MALGLSPPNRKGSENLAPRHQASPPGQEPARLPQQEPEWGLGPGAPGRVCGEGTCSAAAAVTVAALRITGRDCHRGTCSTQGLSQFCQIEDARLCRSLGNVLYGGGHCTSATSRASGWPGWSGCCPHVTLPCRVTTVVGKCALQRRQQLPYYCCIWALTPGGS